MRRPDRAVPIRESMNVNVSPRRNVESRGSPSVLMIGIRNMKRLIKLRVLVSRIQNIDAFGCAMVALPLLWSYRLGSQRYFVTLNHGTATEEL